MSAEQQNALLQEGLDQSWWWRTWASIKHGLPNSPPRNVIEQPKAAPTIVEPVKKIAETVTSTITSTATQVSAPVKSAPWKAIALGSLLTVGGGAGGAYLTNWLNEKPAPIVSPATSDGETTGDLLLYLRENAYHLPPETK